MTRYTFLTSWSVRTDFHVSIWSWFAGFRSGRCCHQGLQYALTLILLDDSSNNMSASVVVSVEWLHFDSLWSVFVGVSVAVNALGQVGFKCCSRSKASDVLFNSRHWTWTLLMCRETYLEK